MNQTELYLRWAQDHGNVVTLGDIMRTSFGCEYRRYHSELRQRGYEVIVKLNRKNPSQNIYTLSGDDKAVIRAGRQTINGAETIDEITPVNRLPNDNRSLTLGSVACNFAKRPHSLTVKTAGDDIAGQIQFNSGRGAFKFDEIGQGVFG